MSEESGIAIGELRVDGGPTRNKYLMQFQSDIAEVSVQVPSAEELSGIGAAYAAGIAVGIYDREEVFSQMSRTRFSPKMDAAERDQKYQGWKRLLRRFFSNSIIFRTQKKTVVIVKITGCLFLRIKQM